ncbi:MAG: peptide transporter [Chthonomonadales bacterium]|nr:peptide transporter [Chthonomonadales bacterium]
MAIDDIARARASVEQASVEEGAELQQVQFEEGFTGKTVVGALFVGFIMLPGALYLGLVAGQGLGAAAEWVTIVLFSEVMRRSFLPMKRQEIYILYYVAAMLSSLLLADRGISGGPFGYLIWNQYFRQAPQAGLVANEIPNWVVPPAGSAALTQRTFLHPAWFVPILLLVVGEVLGRLNWMSMGYVLFRVTSDVEKLPFPMAPVAASGATALAEAASKEESWRWRVFSIGTVIGLVFGFFYVGIPVFTGVVFNQAMQLIKIPFFDLTPSTETVLPGALTGISGDLGKVLVGFVLPYPIVLGSLISSLLCKVFPGPNILYSMGAFGSAATNGWTRGMDAINTRLVTDIKFWMSIGIGLQLAVAMIGIFQVIKALSQYRHQTKGRGLFSQVPKGRGDVAIWIPLSVWFVITVFYIVLTQYLLGVDGHGGQFPWSLLIFFGLIWTPINSFISARMMGLTGSGVSFPFLREASIMKSGYPHVDIWYAPIPLADYGPLAQRFREVELTGTKFSSIVKVEFLVLPIFLTASFIFWGFFWHTGAIPSSQHPYAQRFWPLAATFQAMFQTINKPDGPKWVLEGINFTRIGWGIVTGLGLYGGMVYVLKLPQLLFYGMVGGVGAWPADIIPTFFGAWLGQRYFAKRFGLDQWRNYAPVLLAGFACGTGLIAMVSIALSLIAKSVNYLPF